MPVSPTIFLKVESDLLNKYRKTNRAFSGTWSIGVCLEQLTGQRKPSWQQLRGAELEN